jgi:hypothetical protein
MNPEDVKLIRHALIEKLMRSPVELQDRIRDLLRKIK